MRALTTVILAAGHGKRMKSNLAKVLHKVAGTEMVHHVVDVAEEVGSQKIITVVGHDKEQVMASLSERNTDFVEQTEILGTGHAVMMAESYFEDGDVLVLCGDAPLVSGPTLKALIDFHRDKRYKASLISAIMDNPSGYGRIIRDDKREFLKIVEDKDASEAQKWVKEINSGICIFDAKLLKEALKSLKNDNQQGEYYLTDVFEYLKESGHAIGAHVAKDADELMGINNRYHLSVAETYYQARLRKHWMMSGVTMINPESIYIEKNVHIGADTILYAGTQLKGNTRIGESCEIGPNADITDTEIASHVTIKHSTLIEAKVAGHTSVGPYAYLRPKATIGEHVKIGDFVEVKNAHIGNHTKVSHLTYIGDGQVGESVNVGCGVVFVNYDGENKNQTIVGDHAFIGCNTNLVAPVKVGERAYIAAGSTITEDVPDEALAIARERQVNKTNWSSKYKK